MAEFIGILVIFLFFMIVALMVLSLFWQVSAILWTVSGIPITWKLLTAMGISAWITSHFS